MEFVSAVTTALPTIPGVAHASNLALTATVSFLAAGVCALEAFIAIAISEYIEYRANHPEEIILSDDKLKMVEILPRVG